MSSELLVFDGAGGWKMAGSEVWVSSLVVSYGVFSSAVKGSGGGRVVWWCTVTLGGGSPLLGVF